ncbi:hypothetical protein PP653_gp036 [Bacillus phage Basilisk]|uniref:Uncharacterized protein n=1 Tax=Bacillus phage Basilisk TaxID=1296654 RepID=S5MA72_9CAUD|nr:hypothetical protein PP653_gp036 [Bacillus phage Basilisk]AGR46664.1 hypothetical protein BASILISK_131 [Bacillus phage Basilisk]
MFKLNPTIYKLGCEFLETDADEETLQNIINKLTAELGDNYDLEEIREELEKQGYFSNFIEINENIKNYILEYNRD